MRKLAICLVLLFLISIGNPIIQPLEEIEPTIVSSLTASEPSDSDDYFGSSFSSTYTCPDARDAVGNLIVDAELCDMAKMVGEAHNGIVNYMLEAAGNRFSEPSYNAPTALESLYGLDSMIVRIGLDLPPAEQDKGCWVDGTAEPFWMVPCPFFSRANLLSDLEDSTEGREEDTFEFKLLPYLPSPPLEPIPIEPVDFIPPGISGGGAGCHVALGPDGTPGGWTVPCQFGMMSVATAYGDLRPDLLAQTEYLYENNDLNNMTEEERSQASAMNLVHYLESMDPSLRDSGENSTLWAFDLLADYFGVAAAADGSNDTLAELDASIDSVFSSSEYLEASPEVQETVVLMHAVHYASSELWIDYDDMAGTSGRWNWSKFWKVVGDAVGVGAGILIGGGIGGTVAGAAVGSVFGISGGGGEPIVDCALDRSDSKNWWNCAHFVESVRSLEEGDFGYGAEWAPDAVAPMFAYSGDVNFANPDGSVCGDGICSPGEEAGSAHHCPADCGLVGWQSMYVYDTAYDATTAEEDLEFINHVGFTEGTSGRTAYLTIGGVTVLLYNWNCENIDSAMANLHPGVKYSCEDYTGGVSQPDSSGMGALVTINPATSANEKGGCWVSGVAGLIWINPCPGGSPIGFDSGDAIDGCWVYGINGIEWKKPCNDVFSWINIHEDDLRGEGCLGDEIQLDGTILSVWRYPCAKTSDIDADGVIDAWDDCDDTVAGVATDSRGCETKAAIDANNTPGFTLISVLTMLVGAAMISGRRRIRIE